jgi:eukaryotic-like serine/threonine-protein kinase
VPDPVVSTADSELKAHIERALSSNYEVDREIGRGGMGIVYRAKDRRLKRVVAIKILPPELAFRSEIRSRFLREAETAAQLSHPNIVPIYSVDERDGLVYFVMAVVEGENLAKRMHDQGPMDVAEVRRVLRGVADALAYAHARNVIHRDIKPDNILLDVQGRPLVTDFGIARAISEGADSRLTATGMAIGTPAYMSPEQSAGEREVDGRTDLYALGVVGYQMLAGELPFTASSTPAMLVKHISERPVPVDQKRDGIPSDLAQAVMILLEKDPNNRFPSAQALVSALDTGTMPDRPSRVETTGAPSTGRSSGLAGRYEAQPSSRTPLPDVAMPTPDELARWNAQPVGEFRKKLAPYIIVNAVILILTIFTGVDLIGLTAFWSVYIAFKYAKLWSDGYDWRDVFKQPRDRLFFDVVAESADDVTALWDGKKRAQVRERARRKRLGGGAPPLFGDSGERRLPAGAQSGTSTAEVEAATGPHAATVREAAADRAEIARLVDSMPRRERELIPDLLPSANALYDKIRTLAIALAELERSASPGAVAVLEAQISELEAQANPFDRAASDERVKRLAYLKRQRRAALDIETRRDRAAERLRTCAAALTTMRYDVLKLRTGAGTAEHVTLLAERALSLARDVDGVVAAVSEVNRVGSTGERRGTGARS